MARQSINLLVGQWYGKLDNIKAHAQEIIAISAANNISAKTIVDFSSWLAEALDIADNVATFPNVQQYVRDLYGDQSINVIGEFQAQKNALISARDWIATNFPKDGNGYLLFISFTPEGRFTFRQLTSVQTVGLRAELASLIATIA